MSTTQIIPLSSSRNKPHFIDPTHIQAFLNVKTPSDIDNPYYEIIPNEHTFILHDPVIKAPSEKSMTFQFDKIFTEKNEYSYIYEQICKDCISEVLHGMNYLFVSYGITSSDKQKILIGNPDDSYTNINTRGILPRLLDTLLTTINNDDTYKHNNLSINISYICVNKSKVIDLSNYIGKDISSLKETDFINSANEIKNNNKDIISSIKKIPALNVNDVLCFINKITNTFNKLDSASTYHLYSWSQFVFIFYITDNNNNSKPLSTITFILLNGNDNIEAPPIDDRKKKFSSKKSLPISSKPTAKLIQKSKNLIDSQFTYDSIISAISLNNGLNPFNKIKTEDEEKVKLDLSKLTTLLYHVCFSTFIENIKYRIIGSITPLTGFHHIAKDTLMFLFDCKKIISHKDKIPSCINPSDIITTENAGHDKVDSTSTVSGGAGVNVVQKDEVVVDLENKLKLQSKTIQELNNVIQERQNKINVLSQNYKKQIETLKSEFGFNGDVNILMDKNEYSKESKYTKNIRDALDQLKSKTKQSNDLEMKLKEAKDEIAKLKLKNQLCQNDISMIRLYKDVQISREKRENELKCSSKANNELNALQLKIKNLEKINAELQRDISNKHKIITELPSSNIQEEQTNELDVNQIKGDVVKQVEQKFKKEIKGIHKANIQELKTLQDKYELLIQQRNNTINGLNNAYNTLKSTYDFEIKEYANELIKIEEILMNSIKQFKMLFNNNKKNYNIITYVNLKNEYESYLKAHEHNINQVTFPLLYKSLLSQNKLDINNTNINLNLKVHSRPQSAAIGKNKRQQQQSQMQTVVTKTFNKEKSAHCLMKGNNICSSSSNNNDLYTLIKTTLAKEMKAIDNNELIAMTKDELVEFYIKFKSKVNNIEQHAEIIPLYKHNVNIKEFELNENYVMNLQNKIEKLEKNVREQVEENNNSRIVIKSYEKSVDQLRTENMILKKEINDKNTTHKLSYPTFTNYKNNLHINTNTSNGMFYSHNNTNHNSYYKNSHQSETVVLPPPTSTSSTKQNPFNSKNKIEYSNTTPYNNIKAPATTTTSQNAFRTNNTKTKTRPLSAKLQSLHMNIQHNN